MTRAAGQGTIPWEIKTAALAETEGNFVKKLLPSPNAFGIVTNSCHVFRSRAGSQAPSGGAGNANSSQPSAQAPASGQLNEPMEAQDMEEGDQHEGGGANDAQDDFVDEAAPAGGDQADDAVGDQNQPDQVCVPTVYYLRKSF